MGAEKEVTGVSATTPVANEQNASSAAGGEAAKDPVQGLLETVKSLRGDMDELKSQVSQKDQALEFMRNYIAKSQATQQPTQEELSDEDLITVAEARKLAQKEVQTMLAPQMQQQIARMRVEARDRHPDYDEVIALANEVVARNPSFEKLLLGDPEHGVPGATDPFEMAYQIGMIHEKYREKKVDEAGKNAAEKIVKNLGRQTTLAQVGGGGGKDVDTNKYKRLAEENPAAFNKILHDLIFDQK